MKYKTLVNSPQDDQTQFRSYLQLRLTIQGLEVTRKAVCFYFYNLLLKWRGKPSTFAGLYIAFIIPYPCSVALDYYKNEYRVLGRWHGWMFFIFLTASFIIIQCLREVVMVT